METDTGLQEAELVLVWKPHNTALRREERRERDRERETSSTEFALVLYRTAAH